MSFRHMQIDECLVFFIFFVYTCISKGAIIDMEYVVLDLEWNQCPDGKPFEKKALPFEIIEIGAVKLDHEYHEIDRYFELIKPTVYHSFHFMTKQITHRDIKDFHNARTFSDVIQHFLRWAGTAAHFCTWGSLDLFELQRNILYHGFENPFPKPLYFYDLQKIFSIAYEDRKSRRTLEYAVNFFSLPKELPFHEAMTDAHYTAEILKMLPVKDVSDNYSIDYFQNPQSRKEEIYAQFDNYFKYVSKEFPSKTAAMADRRVTSTKCYLCRQNAKRKIRWFSNGARNYYSLSYCEQHGWIKGKIHIKKTADNRYFCVKTLKLIDFKEAASIRAKQELLRGRRAMKRISQKQT